MNKQELIKKIADAHAIHKGYAEVIVNAIDVEGWLRDPEQVPGRTITLETLSTAWESAEVGTPRKGDVVIEGYPTLNGPIVDRPDGTSFDVYQVTADFAPVDESRCLRILSRAPEPSNAEKIKSLLARWTGDVQDCLHMGLPEFLVNNGVTVKAPGGDDE